MNTCYYTGKGDSGTTSLPTFGKVYKDDLIIDLLGEIDELEVMIGECRIVDPASNDQLIKIQSDLKNIMSALCVTDYDLILDVKAIEELIKSKSSLIKTNLNEFIYPGSCIEEITYQKVRVITRKVERTLVRFSRSILNSDDMVKASLYDLINNMMLSYFNRLSSFFFVMCRLMTNICKAKEITRYEI